MRRHYILAELRTKDREFVRQMLPIESRCSLRLNGVSTAYLTIGDTHPAIPALVEEGARAAVWMVTVDGATLTKRRLLEGRVGDIAGSGPHGQVTVPVRDDFDMFTTLLGWQAPDAPISGQSAAEYARYTGPSETRTLAAIAANVARLGLPWDVAASEGRGTAGVTELRMHKLADKLLDQLTTDRLRLTIERDLDTDRWTVKVVEGQAYPRPITPLSGVLASWQWVKRRPTMTRVVVGGRNEGTAREFITVIDSALEAELGVILEGFVDARTTEEGADITPYGVEALAAAAGKAGITANLRETSWFRFPESYDLGTRMNLQAGTLPVEDVVSQIDITHNRADGFTVVPTVGLAVDDPQRRFVQAVSNIAVTVRGLERR